MIADTIWDQVLKRVHHVRPTPSREATGLTAAVYQRMQADFIPAPLVALHSPVPEILAGVWSVLRETLLAGAADRIHKEAVALTVSKLNECPFCINAHMVMLHATAAHDVADAIGRGDYASIPDAQLRTLVQWVAASQDPDARQGLLPPVGRGAAPEIIGTAVAFHYLNRMANLFLEDALVPVPSALRGVTDRLFGVTAGSRATRQLQPGASLTFIPQADLPADLAWAATNPTVASAFAGLSQAVETAGAAAMPAPVRVLVVNRVQAWQGKPMGLSRAWVEQAVAEVDPAHQDAARLALLTALASYQVDARVIEGFRSQFPDDSSLIAATAWASFTAARRAGLWLAEPLMAQGVSGEQHVADADQIYDKVQIV